eukprot:TRINITY_DN11711_c0_g1_i1.p1 TRINITY_DN11711_c0_g1~~TRINITY_DN11711_c0_g1_i1.p1  ORF type:complete len:759 (+),score=144.26 TRINITY_DN11711_c0_g1_i1:32-2308(+)
MFVLLLFFFYISHSSAKSGFLTFDELGGQPFSVNYNARSLLINNEPVLFLSGSLHYPRSTPGMWDSLMQQARDDGLNMLEVYVFWNEHQPREGDLDFSDRKDLRLFLSKAAQHGLFVDFRIGPYICAETNYGGIPAWVGQKKNIMFRTYNSVWMNAMQQWMQTLVAYVRDFFADRGGPIVMAQIENELSESTDKRYISWCGELAESQKVNVPWIMCNGASAPNTINTCNSNDCISFAEKHGQSGQILKTMPLLWTENEGWFQVWGERNMDEDPSHHSHGYSPSRKATEISYTIGRFFARGGSLHNYYMWFGGNNYARLASGGVTNIYADDVNLRADTTLNEPKHTHLKHLHQVLIRYAETILRSPAQMEHAQHLLWWNEQTKRWENGTQQLAFVYRNVQLNDSSMISFIESSATVQVLTQYNGKSYSMAPESVIMIDAFGNILYDTSILPKPEMMRIVKHVSETPFEWQVWPEPLDAFTNSSTVIASSPSPQIAITHDLTDYMYYEHEFTTLLAGKHLLSLPTVEASAFLIYIDGIYQGEMVNHLHSDRLIALTHSVEVTKAGKHSLTILSASLGISNGMTPGSGAKEKGILGSVSLDLELLSGQWKMRPFLSGELFHIMTDDGAKNVTWNQEWKSFTGHPATWYQTFFPSPTLPPAPSALLLEAAGMWRGRFWLNGKDLGRYYLINGKDTTEPTQLYYHIPPDYLRSSGVGGIGGGGLNRLTLFEEVGSRDPTQMRLAIVQMIPSTTTAAAAGARVS